MHAPFHHRQVLLAMLITTFVHVAVAEDAKLPTISVTAPPLVDSQTLNASTVDKEELRSLAPATSDTASLLRNVPGLSLQGAGGVSSMPIIRGLADDRLRIKVDGMDLISACANHMNPPLSYIDPTNVSSAVVFAGITPVSIGGDSIGGTILIDSAAPEFAEAGEGLLTRGEIGGFYRSNGDARGGNVAATVAGEKVSLSYQGSTTKANNYDAGDDFKPKGKAAAGRGWLDGDEVGSSQYKSTNQSVALGLLHENHLVDIKYSEQDIPYQGWPNQRMDMTDNDSSQINLGYKGQYDWGGLDARVYNEHTRHKMQFDDDKLFWYGSNSGTPYVDGEPCTPSGGKEGCAAGMPMDTRGNNTGATVKADVPLSPRDLLRVGVELQNYDLDDWWKPSGKGMWPDTFRNVNDGERDRVALFSEWEAEWNREWLTQLGVRGERVDMDTGKVQGYNAMYEAEAAAFNAADRDKTDNNIDLTALARFTPNAMNAIEFGYARKTRSPNIYERYAWSTGGMAMRMVNWAGDGNGYVGNLDLDPEVAHTVSATLDWHDARQAKWGLQLTPYYTYIDDYIDTKRCSTANCLKSNTENLTSKDSFVYLRFVNQSARMYGIDVSGYYPLAENTPYGSFTATGILNYVRGENDDTDDDLYNIKPLNARLAVVHRLNSWTSTIELELVDEKTKVSQVRNELETSGYGLVHLRSSYEWRQVRFDIGVDNLFDKFYDDPLGGAYLGQGKTMSGTGVPWGVAVPGMGRSVYAGLSYMF